ncbi:MAG: hypothetical protein F6K39_21480 [Okeania sp. SIO3B3]|nr:hypothetical protein [Okeania sp. SIO3B3]
MQLLLISCPVEYLHFGGGKAKGRRQEAEGKKRLEGKRFFYHCRPYSQPFCHGTSNVG